MRGMYFSGLCILMFLNLCGCSRLRPGRITDLDLPATPRVVLIRGFLDWYSIGIDQLADELRAAGIPCTVFRDSQWHQVSRALAHDRTQAPIVLIGFSYGADDVVSISRNLSSIDRPIALLITIDPVTPARIPSCVVRCENFYESNGALDFFPWLRGIPVVAETKQCMVDNINIRCRADLLEPDTRHATIAANPKVHAAIVAEVKRHLGRVRATGAKVLVRSQAGAPEVAASAAANFAITRDDVTPKPHASGG